MSEALQTAPKTGAAISIMLVLRIALILLGIMSATLMGQEAFGAQWSERFLAVLAVIRDAVGTLVAPLDLLVVQPGLRILRSWGVDITLHDHWKHVFVLMWLVLGAWAKFQTAAQPTLAFRIFNFVWGFVCAAAAGVASGTAEYHERALLFWPLAALCLYFTGRYARTLLFERHDATVTTLTALCLIGSAIFTGYCTLVAVGVVPMAPFSADGLPNPGLAMLAAFVAFFGFYLFMMPSIKRGGDIEFGEWLHARQAQAGIDILSVMGGAAFLVWLGNVLSGF
jgi:hypothetical protein